MAVVDEAPVEQDEAVCRDECATIVLAGFRGVLRLGLRQAIERDGVLQVRGEDPPEGSDVGRLSALVEEQQPHVVLMHCDLFSTTIALRRFVLAHPATSVAVAVPHERHERDQALLAAGARAVVPLTVEADELRTLVWFLARGLVGSSGRPVRDPAAGIGLLTEREAEVLELLVERRSAAAIGEALGVSVATVNSHRYRIYEKLGIHSRRELAVYAEDARRWGPRQMPATAPGARDRVAYTQTVRQSRALDRTVVIDFCQALGARRWLSRSR
jgi:DNA-binding NarL/FixJ family response regulator